MKRSGAPRRLIVLGAGLVLLGVVAPFVAPLLVLDWSFAHSFSDVAVKPSSTPAVASAGAGELMLVCAVCAGPGLGCIAVGAVMLLGSRSASRP
jgi:hypothetical protein